MARTEYDWVLGKAPPFIEAHSRAKHRILTSYLRSYIQVVAANPRRERLNLTIVDGFAGGGEFSTETGIASGSPLLMLQEVEAQRIERQAARRKEFTLDADFIFIERSKSTYDYLRDAVRRSSASRQKQSTISLINGCFEDSLEALISRIKGRDGTHRSFFFLDQCGYNEVSLVSIRHIINELAWPEIFLTFNVDYIIDYLAKTPSFLKAVAPIELSLQQIEDILAFKSMKGARWFIQHYLLQHLKRATGANFYTYFFIKSPDSHRSYWLVHISKHYRARDVMGQKHWEVKNSFIHHGASGLKMAGFDPDVDLDQQTMDFVFGSDDESLTLNSLMDDIPRELFHYHRVKGEAISLEKFFAAHCNEMVGTSDHMMQVLTTLRSEGDIAILDSEGRPKPRANKLSWSDLIVPVAQPTFFSRLKPKSED